MSLFANMVQLGHLTFLVRSQAGFRKALKMVNRRHGETLVCEDFPKAYPTVVTFSYGYRSYWYLSACCQSAQKYYDNMKATMRLMEESDPGLIK